MQPPARARQCHQTLQQPVGATSYFVLPPVNNVRAGVDCHLETGSAIQSLGDGGMTLRHRSVLGCMRVSAGSLQTAKSQSDGQQAGCSVLGPLCRPVAAPADRQTSSSRRCRTEPVSAASTRPCRPALQCKGGYSDIPQIFVNNKILWISCVWNLKP